MQHPFPGQANKSLNPDNVWKLSSGCFKLQVHGQRTSGECWKQALTAVGNRVKLQLQFGLRNQPELLNFQGSTNQETFKRHEFNAKFEKQP